MSARRQASTTSLSQFARTGSPVGQHGSLDFCNSFWGFRDQGFDVLSRRMRGAIHTTEELRNFWKERAAIEEDYAKRLSKLSKLTLGKDEVGDLRRSLDSVKGETEKQAGYHMTLAQQIRTELETPSADFQSKQMHHKKTYLASIEKQVKAKQLQESHVDKAREKYEQDCMKINSYTAQSSLVQGKDLEKIQLKLERARQTVQANEREFANFTRAIESTVQKWEQDWKAFCDGCQDLEEARVDFMKDNMWSYANLVSTVCVADDESCERIRLSLEQMETEREMENFVTVYGTGSQIPDPPAFVNYQLPDAIPSSASQSTFRYANFTRSSARDVPIQLHRNSTYIPPQLEEDPPVNTAGRGAGVPRRADTLGNDNLARQPTQRNSVYGGQQTHPYANGNGTGHSPLSSQNHQSHNQINSMPGTSSSPGASSSGVAIQRRPTNAASSQLQNQSSYRPSSSTNDPLAEPVDPTAETYIKVGNHAYKVDPSKDPQMNSGLGGASGSGPANRANGGALPAAKQNGVDPLQKQLEELQNVVSTSGSSRRNTMYRSQALQMSNPGQGGSGSGHTKNADSLSAPVSLSPPATSPSPGASGSRDYRNSAEFVVGAPPPVASRSPSPNPPTATFMIPKNAAVPGTEVVTEVLADYHQSLPGERERKALSRTNSRRGSFVSQHMQSPSSASAGTGGYGPTHRNSLIMNTQQGQALGRPPSAGHAGIGAHGGQSRSNSPQPPSRGPSPAPGEIVNVGNFTGQTQQQQQQQQQPPQGQRRNSTYITPPSAGTPIRTTSPNPVGIALDPSGRVSHDEMAQRYQMQQQQQRGQTPLGHQPQPYGGIQQPPPQHPQQQSRRSSYLAAAGNSAPGPPPSMAPPAQPLYQPVTPPPPPPQVLSVYHPPQQQQPQQGYMQPGPAAGQQGAYGQYPQQQSPVSYQPSSQQQNAYATVNAIVGGQPQQRGVGGNGAYGVAPSQSQSQTSLAVRGGGGYRASSPGPAGGMVVGRSPSPQPLTQRISQQQVQQIQPPPPMQQQMPIGHQQMQQTTQGLIPQPIQGQVPGRYPQSQTTEDGQPILFYVKALYDYQATIDEEFDFQTGDIIAVTATPDDGWWSGELLDEARRQRGRHVFPSNFVCLF